MAISKQIITCILVIFVTLVGSLTYSCQSANDRRQLLQECVKNGGSYINTTNIDRTTDHACVTKDTVQFVKERELKILQQRGW